MTGWLDLVAEITRTAVVAGAIGRLLAASAWDAAVRRDDAHSRLARRLRATLERLGPTFIKFGQFLAVRFDLLPLHVCQSLDELFENVQRVPFDDVRAIVEHELGAPLDRVFGDFDPMPIAAASLAQVHSARTRAGVHVAVKVQRPGVVHIIRTDLRIMRHIARVADGLGAFGAISLTEMIAQFSHYAEREVDFVEEGRTADTLRRNAAHGEIIPEVHWPLTTAKVLTLDFIEGVSLAEIAARGRPDGVSERLPEPEIGRVLHTLAFSALHQMFVAGTFHGDPHPGNVIVRADYRVALVDFGIAGHLAERERVLLRRYLGFLALGNFEESYRHYAQLFQPTEDTDLALFKRQTLALMRQWHRLAGDPSAPPHLRLAGRFSDRMTTLVRQHRLRISMDTMLFWRVLITLDSTALRFTAHFDMLRELRLFFTRLQAEELLQAVTGLDAEQVLLGWQRSAVATTDALRVLGRPESTPARVVVDESRAVAGLANSRTSRLTAAVLGASAIASASWLFSAEALPLAMAVVAAAMVSGWVLRRSGHTQRVR